MDARKLVARYMLESYPITIARKNWYEDKKANPFKGWCVRKSEATGPAGDEETAKECEAFLHRSPFAFVVACQFDLGKPAWKAWRAPYLIARRVSLPNFNPRYLCGMDNEELVALINAERLGCRNLGHEKAANNLIALSSLLVARYHGQADKLWTEPQTFPELRNNLLEIPGFGPGITNMSIKIMLELGMLPQIPKDAQSLRELQVKADVHVKKVFYRTGLAEEEAEKSAYDAARKYSPERRTEGSGLDNALRVSQGVRS